MNQVAFLLLYPILWGFSILPMRVLYGLSSACYYLVYYVFGYRKAVVKQNLQRAFPNRSERDLKVIGHKFYRHLCDLIFESLKSLTISERELKKRFTYSRTRGLSEILYLLDNLCSIFAVLHKRTIFIHSFLADFPLNMKINVFF